MSSPTQERALRAIARRARRDMARVYGTDVAFFIAVTLPDSLLADYISNIDRQTAVKVLRETADRLDNNEDIGPTTTPVQ